MYNLLCNETALYMTPLKHARLVAHKHPVKDDFWYRELDHQDWVLVLGYYARVLFERGWLAAKFKDDETLQKVNEEKERLALVEKQYWDFFERTHKCDTG